MKRPALITGASTGIGRELARIHASKGRDLVIVARSEEKLQSLAEELRNAHGVQVRVVPMDLSDPDKASELKSLLDGEGIQPEFLINNAGVAELANFEERDPERVQKELRLNIECLTLLTRYFATDMLRRGSGRILNVASTAAFQPGPHMAVYYASKSYVLSFSQALDTEWRKRGVTVTALCPGPTSSEFQERAGMDKIPLFETVKPHSSEAVAKKGYRAMEKGKLTVIPGVMNKLGAFLVRFLPKRVVMGVVRGLHSRA